MAWNSKLPSKIYEPPVHNKYRYQMQFIKNSKYSTPSYVYNIMNTFMLCSRNNKNVRIRLPYQFIVMLKEYLTSPIALNCTNNRQTNWSTTIKGWTNINICTLSWDSLRFINYRKKFGLSEMYFPIDIPLRIIKPSNMFDLGSRNYISTILRKNMRIIIVINNTHISVDLFRLRFNLRRHKCHKWNNRFTICLKVCNLFEVFNHCKSFKFFDTFMSKNCESYNDDENIITCNTNWSEHNNEKHNNLLPYMWYEIITKIVKPAVVTGFSGIKY
jgi:hypothetical protein